MPNPLTPPRNIRKEDIPRQYEDLYEKVLRPLMENQRNVHSAVTGRMALLDNLNLQVAEIPVTVPETWVEIPDADLQESWKAYGDYGIPSYMRDAWGRVHLRGAVHRATPNHKRGTQLTGLLPEAYRPPKTRFFPLASSGLSCAAIYTTDTNQTWTTSGTVYIVDYEDQELDTDVAVTTGGSWKFTVPTGKGGKYFVQAAVTVTSTGTGSYLMFLYKNNSVHSLIGRVHPDSATSFTLAGSRLISLSAGDYIDIRVQQNTGASKSTNNSAGYNHVSIHRVHEDCQLKVGSDGKLEVFGGYTDRVHLDGISWEAAASTPPSMALESTVRLQKKISGSTGMVIVGKAVEVEVGTNAPTPVAAPVWVDWEERGDEIVIRNVTGLTPGRKYNLTCLVIPKE